MSKNVSTVSPGPFHPIIDFPLDIVGPIGVPEESDNLI